MGSKLVTVNNKLTSTITDVDAFVTTYPTITVPNGSALSGAIDLGRDMLVGLIVPAALEATSAQLSFFGSDTLGGTYGQIKQGGTKLALPVAVNDHGLLANFTDLAGVRFLKIQIETAGGVAVAQTADRVFKAIKVAAF